MTEKDRKATGWKAHYRNGKWEEEHSTPRTGRRKRS
jgi:hypothetical protein